MDTLIAEILGSVIACLGVGYVAGWLSKLFGSDYDEKTRRTVVVVFGGIATSGALFTNPTQGIKYALATLIAYLILVGLHWRREAKGIKRQ